MDKNKLAEGDITFYEERHNCVRGVKRIAADEIIAQVIFTYFRDTLRFHGWRQEYGNFQISFLFENDVL